MREINIYSDMNYDWKKLNKVTPDIQYKLFSLDKLKSKHTSENDYLILICPRKRHLNQFITYLDKFNKNRFLVFFENPANHIQFYNTIINKCDKIFTPKIINDKKHIWVPYFHYLCMDEKYICNKDYSFKINNLNLKEKTKFMCNNPISTPFKQRLNILDKFKDEDIHIYMEVKICTRILRNTVKNLKGI